MILRTRARFNPLDHEQIKKKYDSGIAALNAKNYLEAIQQFTNILEDDPYHAKALHFRALAFESFDATSPDANIKQLAADDRQLLRHLPILSSEERFSAYFINQYKSIHEPPYHLEDLTIKAKQIFLAIGFHKRAEYDKAFIHAKEVLNDYPAEIFCILILIEAAHALKETAQLQTALDSLKHLMLYKEYNIPTYWLERTRLHLELKESSEATRCFVHALNEDTHLDNPMIHPALNAQNVLYFAPSLEALDRETSAPLEEKFSADIKSLRRQLETSIKNNNTLHIIQIASELLHHQPLDTELYQLRGDAHHKRGDRQSAIRNFTMALWLLCYNPPSKPLQSSIHDSNIFLLYMRTSKCYLEENQFLQSWDQIKKQLNFIGYRIQNIDTFLDPLITKIFSFLTGAPNDHAALNAANHLFIILSNALKITKNISASIKFYLIIADKILKLAQNKRMANSLSIIEVNFIDMLVNSITVILNSICKAVPSHGLALKKQSELESFKFLFQARNKTAPLKEKKEIIREAKFSEEPIKEIIKQESTNANLMAEEKRLAAIKEKAAAVKAAAKTAKKAAKNALRKAKKAEAAAHAITSILPTDTATIVEPSCIHFKKPSEKQEKQKENIFENIPCNPQASTTLHEEKEAAHKITPVAKETPTLQIIDTPRLKLPIRDTESKALTLLSEEGKKAYIKGSTVRNRILTGKIDDRKDVDIYTNASPEKIKSVFKGIDESRARPGLFQTSLQIENNNIIKIEVSSYETCDFTINALALDKEGYVDDLTGRGLMDLAQGNIDTVIDATKSLTPSLSTTTSSDPLRVLRAIYLEVETRKFGFKLSDQLKHVIQNIPRLLANENDEKEIGRFNGWLFKIFHLENNVEHFNALLDAGIFEKLFTPAFAAALKIDREWLCQELAATRSAGKKIEFNLLFLVSAYQQQSPRTPFDYDILVKENPLLRQSCDITRSELRPYFLDMVARWEAAPYYTPGEAKSNLTNTTLDSTENEIMRSTTSSTLTQSASCVTTATFLSADTSHSSDPTIGTRPPASSHTFYPSMQYPMTQMSSIGSHIPYPYLPQPMTYLSNSANASYSRPATTLYQHHYRVPTDAKDSRAKYSQHVSHNSLDAASVQQQRGHTFTNTKNRSHRMFAQNNILGNRTGTTQSTSRPKTTPHGHAD
jgi:hypothetical protein